MAALQLLSLILGLQLTMQYWALVGPTLPRTMLLLAQWPRSWQHPLLDNEKETGLHVEHHSENFPTASGVDI